jgi:hypothetical protein
LRARADAQRQGFTRVVRRVAGIRDAAALRLEVRSAAREQREVHAEPATGVLS